MIKPLSAAGYDTDKSRAFLRNYETYFSRFTGTINLLELGILRGGSLQLWRDYFDQGAIVGLDINEVEVPDQSGRIRIYQGRQEDMELLDHIGKESGPFEIIIDDASHLAKPTMVSFWKLFDQYLVPGGVYVIEDWRVGYWAGWPDGRQYPKVKKHTLFRHKDDPKRFESHDYGLVGFVKQLVDEMGADAFTHSSRGSTEAHRMPKFRSIEFFPGQVFITKSTPEDDLLVREPWENR